MEDNPEVLTASASVAADDVQDEDASSVVAAFRRLAKGVREELDAATEQALTVLAEREEALNKRIRVFESHQAHLEGKYGETAEVVDLNVGGKRFTTLRSTLCSHPDSMLAAMFSGRHPLSKDRKGACVIDRSGKLFAYVLLYLQTGELPEVPESLYVMFVREMDYFGLDMPPQEASESGMVRFLGYADWSQNAQVDSDEQQWLKMNTAAAEAFPDHPEARAATADEYFDGVITGLPIRNGSGKICCFVGEKGIGDRRDHPVLVSGHNLAGLRHGEDFNGARFPHRDLYCSTRSCVVVEPM